MTLWAFSVIFRELPIEWKLRYVRDKFDLLNFHVKFSDNINN